MLKLQQFFQAPTCYVTVIPSRDCNVFIVSDSESRSSCDFELVNFLVINYRMPPQTDSATRTRICKVNESLTGEKLRVAGKFVLSLYTFSKCV